MSEQSAIWIHKALKACFISPNVPDRNMEPANLVDATAALATAINRLADAIERNCQSTPHEATVPRMTDGGDDDQ